jgi:hypothetical protein
MVEMVGDIKAVLSGLHQGSVAIRKKVMMVGEIFLGKGGKRWSLKKLRRQLNTFAEGTSASEKYEVGSHIHTHVFSLQRTTVYTHLVTIFCIIFVA